MRTVPLSLVLCALLAGCNGSDATRGSALHDQQGAGSDAASPSEDPTSEEGEGEGDAGTPSGCAFRAMTTDLSWTHGWHALPGSKSIGFSGRWGHVQVWTGNELFVWGGVSETGLSNDGAVLYPDAKKSTWKSAPSSPLSKRYTALSVWTGHEILIWGGNDGFHGSTPIGPLLDGASFDPCSGAWSMLPKGPMPDVVNPGATGLRFRGAWLAATQELFVIGYDVAGSFAAAYAPSKRTWRSITDLPKYVVGMPFSVVGAHVVFLGEGANPEPVNPQGWDYDVKANTWRPINPPVVDFFPWIGVHFATKAGFFGNTFDTTSGKQALAFRAYRPADGLWSELAAPDATVLPQQTNVTTLADGDRYLFAYGGYSFYEADAALYDKTTNRWLGIGKPTPSTRERGLGQATWANDAVIQYGGTSWGVLKDGGLSEPYTRDDALLYRP